MVTITPELAGHFYDLYINGKENAKLTGDRMKLLMLTLPFMARDLIAPEVYPLLIDYPISIPCLSHFYIMSRSLSLMQQSTGRSLAHGCRAFLTSQIPVTMSWRC